MDKRSRNDPQLYVWMVTLNHDVGREEFQRCMQSVDPGLRKELKRYGRVDIRMLRHITSNLLPKVMMGRYRVPSNRWSFETTDSGKSYIDSPELGKSGRKVVGYNIASEGSVVALAFAQGRKHQVVNIGMDVMRMPTLDVDVDSYVESHLHKIAPFEESFLLPILPKEVILRRLCIILTVKQAYIKAINQPPGFDLSRIEVNVPHSISVDGKPVHGWEFRLFRANLGVQQQQQQRGAKTPVTVMQQEVYQCVSAIYRGWDRTMFVLGENQQELETWMQFVTVEQVAKCTSAMGPGASASPAQSLEADSPI